MTNTPICPNCLEPIDEKHWWSPGAGCYEPSARIVAKDYIVRVGNEMLIEKDGKLKIERAD